MMFYMTKNVQDHSPGLSHFKGLLVKIKDQAVFNRMHVFTIVIWMGRT